MKYILDASVAVSWVLPEKHSPKAVRLRNEFRKGLHELLAPDIFPGEVANALTRAERKKIIPHPQSMKRFIQAMRFAPELHPYIPLLSKALAISSSMRVAIYDCLYVALAEQEQCELVTSDDKLVNAVQKQFSFVVHLSTFP